MSSLKRRTRVVNFRLSDVEYARLRASCEEHGANSISDFTRAAVYRLIDRDAAATHDPLAAAVGVLVAKVERLDREMKRLSRLLGSG